MASIVRYIVKLLNSCLAIVLATLFFAFSPYKALGSLSCTEFYLDGKLTFDQFLTLGKWLGNNRHSIEPTKHHLERLIPIAVSIQRSLKLGLKEKKNESLFDKRRSYIESITEEIDLRIFSKTLTYEYLYALPFRTGFLLNMRDSQIMGKKKIEDIDKEILPELFDVEIFATHEAFIKFINTERNPTSKTETLFAAKIREGLRRFPDLVLLPINENLTFSDMNILLANGIWPLGFATKPIEADGRIFSELVFALHDLAHALSDFEVYELFEDTLLPTSLIRQVEKPVYSLIKSIERKQRPAFSEIDIEVLNFIHYQIFHENARLGWTHESSSLNRHALLSNSISLQLSKIVRMSTKDSLIRSEIIGIVKNEDIIEPVLERNIQRYRQMFSLALLNSGIQ